MSNIDANPLEPRVLRELQLKGLEVLRYFKDFCDENNLLFYFCGGCCIGALRNKGFIPWDDDVDVFMPRDDYEKLYNLWNKKADVERYSCIKTTDGDNFSGHIFTTVADNNTTLIKPSQKDLDIPHGVTIDIFPLDGCPKNRFKRRIQKLWALIYSLYIAQIIPKNHGKSIEICARALLRIVPSRGLRCKIGKFAEKQMSKYKIKDCKFITELCAGPGYMKNEYPKDIFSSVVYKEFEGEEFPLPKGYDEYLRIAFGDYMTPPPAEKRIAHHDILFLDLKNSYKKYKGIKYLTEVKK